jgi:uncharacterized protein
VAKTKRVQVLMEPGEFAELERLARSRGASVADLMREAARAQYLNADEQGRRARAAEAFLGPIGVRSRKKSRPAVTRLFLDSNVFLYAVGADSPHRDACRSVLQGVGQGTLDGVTSSEVLQEILHVRSRRVGVADATSAVRAAASLVAEVLPVTSRDVLEACRLLESHSSLGARDALHAAVMKNSLVHVLVSVDRDFDRIADLKRIEPAAALLLSR